MYCDVRRVGGVADIDEAGGADVHISWTADEA